VSPAWRAPAALAVLACAGCAPDPGDDLVVVSFDTVRRDHLPTYGYKRSTAPALDAFARGAVVFDDAYAQETNTNPSHSSMFTGLYPHTHGNRRNGDRLPAGRVTLAQILREAGFRTGAFVSGSTLKRKACGLERGFEVYDDEFDGKRRAGARTTRLALDWLRRRSGERFFLFLHLFDVHGPYLPEGGYRARFRSPEPGPEVDVPPYQLVLDEAGNPRRDLNGYVDRYDAMIRYVDDRLAELLGELDLGRTIVVVLADHGETLGERYHKLDHGAQLFDEQIRIPLVLHAPGVAPRRVAGLVETVDLLPTLLELLRVEAVDPLPLQGRSLAAALRSGGEGTARDAVFSAARPVSRRHADRGYRLDRRRQIHSVRSAGWKLIRYPGLAADPLELYDLAADPAERRNVAAERPDIRDEYLGRLDAWLGSADEPLSPPEVDPELLDELRHLGYVGG